MLFRIILISSVLTFLSNAIYQEKKPQISFDASYGTTSPNDNVFDGYCPYHSAIANFMLFKYQNHALGAWYISGLVYFCNVTDSNGKEFTSRLFSYDYPDAIKDGYTPPDSVSIPNDQDFKLGITEVKVSISLNGDYISNMEIGGSTVYYLSNSSAPYKSTYNGCALVGIRGSYDDLAIRTLVFAYDNCEDPNNNGRDPNLLYGKIMGIPDAASIGTNFVCSDGHFLIKIEGPLGNRVSGIQFTCSDGFQSDIFGQQFDPSANPGQANPFGIYHVTAAYHQSEGSLIYLSYRQNYDIGNNGATPGYDNFQGDPLGNENILVTTDESGKVMSPMFDFKDNYGCKAVGAQVWTGSVKGFTLIKGLEMIYNCNVPDSPITTTTWKQQMDRLDQIESHFEMAKLADQLIDQQRTNITNDLPLLAQLDNLK